MTQEIERKFIVNKLPKLSTLDWLETQNIYQVYLAIGDEQIRAREIIRSNGNNFILTVKRGHGLSRKEIETSISEPTYYQLQKSVFELGKTRHIISINGIKTYIDVFHQHNLIIAEIEFPNEYDAQQFEPPIWFNKEVTGEPKYENQYLWKKIQRY